MPDFGSSKSSSGSSASESSSAAPCSCPDGLDSSYTVSLSAGGITDSSANVYTWPGGTFTVTGGGCSWSASGLDYFVNGIPQTGTLVLFLDTTPCFGVCSWVIKGMGAEGIALTKGGADPVGSYNIFTGMDSCSPTFGPTSGQSGTATVS
jgi:hypothetical protein